MTDDAERDPPDRLYVWTAKETIDRLRKVIEGQGLSMQAMTRELGEAHAKVSELGIALNDARARCEQIVDAVRDEQRRIADARVAQVRRELGGFAPADKHSWMTGWG